MPQRISLKVKEIGEIVGEFFRSTSSGVWLRRACFGKSTLPHIDFIKIAKSSIVSASRVDEPPFFQFSDSELLQISGMVGSKYAKTASTILKSRNVTKVASFDTSRVVPAKASHARAEGDEGSSSCSQADASKVNLTSSEAGMRKATAKGKKPAAEWNQFETNARLYGIEPRFDIDEYAPPIDKSDKDYVRRMEESVKIAQEILQETTSDQHKLEERGVMSQSMSGNNDSQYSTVSKSTWESSVAGEQHSSSKKGKSTDNCQQQQHHYTTRHSDRGEQGAVAAVEKSKEKGGAGSTKSSCGTVGSSGNSSSRAIHEKVERKGDGEGDRISEIDEVVKELKDKVKSAMDEGDKGSMWANISSMLSAKKKVEERLREKNADKHPKEIQQKDAPKEAQKVQHADTTSSLKQQHRGRNQATGTTLSSSLPSSSTIPQETQRNSSRGERRDRKFDRERMGGRSSNPDRQSSESSQVSPVFNKVEVSTTEQNDQGKRAAPKQVILGRKLRFEKVSMAVETISNNLKANKNREIPETWGTGASMADQIDRFIPRSNLPLPSESRLAEMGTAGTKRFSWL